MQNGNPSSTYRILSRTIPQKNSSNLEATHGLWSRLHNGIKNNKKIVEHGTDSAMMLAGSKNIF